MQSCVTSITSVQAEQLDPLRRAFFNPNPGVQRSHQGDHNTQEQKVNTNGGAQWKERHLLGYSHPEVLAVLSIHKEHMEDAD